MDVLSGAIMDNILKNISEAIDRDYPYLDALYRNFHAHPELSQQERETAARVARELESAGYHVLTGIGGHGVAGVLENGAGPAILVRADMDALPISEETGLPYASRVRVADGAGGETGVMHACGHDIHMTVMIGAARVLAAQRRAWRGTLICVGQPSEERMSGARAMLEDGFYNRVPRPAAALSLHTMPSLPAGHIGLCPGYAWANADIIKIIVRGAGGHGAWPHLTHDPVTLAAQLVLAFQTIIGREVDPCEPALVSVGSIHGGTAFNIIPDEVTLNITVRTYSESARTTLIDAIRRTAAGLARAAGFPENLLPEVQIPPDVTKAICNDPALSERVARAARKMLGDDRVMDIKPEMGGEDFGQFGDQEPPIPLTIFRLGTTDPVLLARGGATPKLHSCSYAPLPEPTIKGGIKAMAAVLIDLMPV